MRNIWAGGIELATANTAGAVTRDFAHAMKSGTRVTSPDHDGN
jgi:hypothetical protein